MQSTVTLKENRDFKRLYRSQFSAGRLVVCYAAKGRTSHTRIGITVGKKLGCAVKRNRCRRLLRAAYQELEKECTGCWDLVLVARAPSLSCKTQEVTSDLRRQLCRLGIILKNNEKSNSLLTAEKRKARALSFTEGQKSSQNPFSSPSKERDPLEEKKPLFSEK